MARDEVANYYDKLKHDEHLDKNDCVSIQYGNWKSVQLASLAVLLARRNQNTSEKDLLQWIMTKNKLLGGFLAERYSNTVFDTASCTPTNWLRNLFIQTRSDGTIGSEKLGRFVNEYVSKNLSDDIVAAWLMVVCMEGLSKDDVDILTMHMRDSGEIFDYRDHSALKTYTLVRRYPTGALSEKAALILPSLISAANAEYKIASPFLVARSLSFTGGTWDKLNSIPGFHFPHPGAETIDYLRRCGVAMTVTHGNLNPADRMMYQLRSVTGTVESEELIIASIASKQLAVPVHQLLMDIRYGDGSFFCNHENAKSFASKLQQTITMGGVPTLCHFTGTNQPGGASVGNALEVAEAITVLGGGNHDWWDSRWIYEQKTFIIDFFCKLMSSVVPEQPVRFWANLADRWLKDGTALDAFKKILEVHGVNPDFVKKLIEEPFPLLEIKSSPKKVYAVDNGVLNNFDQRGIGNFVNIVLGGGGNHYSGDFCPSTGIILLKRLGDPVKSGDTLCYVFSPNKLQDEYILKLRKCFIID